MFIGSGSNFFRDSELGPVRLEEMGDNRLKGQKVDAADLELIAMAGTQQPCATLELHKIPGLFTARAATLQDPPSGRLHGYLYSIFVDKKPDRDAAHK
jgi:hypothetical protein